MLLRAVSCPPIPGYPVSSMQPCSWTSPSTQQPWAIRSDRSCCSFPKQSSGWAPLGEASTVRRALSRNVRETGHTPASRLSRLGTPARAPASASMPSTSCSEVPTSIQDHSRDQPRTTVPPPGISHTPRGGPSSFNSPGMLSTWGPTRDTSSSCIISPSSGGHSAPQSTSCGCWHDPAPSPAPWCSDMDQGLRAEL